MNVPAFATLMAREIDSLRAELARERERHQDVRDSLRKLSNEASGFLAMADRNAHGNTNMAVLKMRIDDARALLEAKSEPAPVATGEEKA